MSARRHSDSFERQFESAVHFAVDAPRRELGSNGPEPSEFERVEVVACPPLGFRAGKDRYVAAAIVIGVLNAPLSAAVAALVDGYLLVKWVAHQHVIEALTARHPRTLGGILAATASLNSGALSGIVALLRPVSIGRDIAVPNLSLVAEFHYKRDAGIVEVRPASDRFGFGAPH
jgi:hypothetical protein